jgi:hypothetical protein
MKGENNQGRENPDLGVKLIFFLSLQVAIRECKNSSEL